MKHYFSNFTMLVVWLTGIATGTQGACVPSAHPLSSQVVGIVEIWGEIWCGGVWVHLGQMLLSFQQNAPIWLPRGIFLGLKNVLLEGSTLTQVGELNSTPWDHLAGFGAVSWWGRNEMILNYWNASQLVMLNSLNVNFNFRNSLNVSANVAW